MLGIIPTSVALALHRVCSTPWYSVNVISNEIFPFFSLTIKESVNSKVLDWLKNTTNNWRVWTQAERVPGSLACCRSLLSARGIVLDCGSSPSLVTSQVDGSINQSLDNTIKALIIVWFYKGFLSMFLLSLPTFLNFTVLYALES